MLRASPDNYCLLFYYYLFITIIIALSSACVGVEKGPGTTIRTRNQNTAAPHSPCRVSGRPHAPPYASSQACFLRHHLISSHPLPLLDPGLRTLMPWVLPFPNLRLQFHTQTFLNLASPPLLASWRIIVSTLPPVRSADDLQSSRCYPFLSRSSKLDSPPPNSRNLAGPPHRLQ